MHNILRNFLASAVLAALAIATTSAAQAQTVITSLPYTITAGGTYVLNSNLSSSATTGNLITINASNVTIDFQEHYITGPSASLASTNVIGIYAYERSNLTIRNGTVAYCLEGIYIGGNGATNTNSVDQQVTNMRVTYCAYVGINLDYDPSSVISDCQISQIGTTSTSDNAGINVDGAGVTVQGCTVSNVVDSTGSQSYGIYSETGSFTRGCQVSSAYYGIRLGIYQNNLASAVTSAFSSGTDGGNNVDDGTTYTAGIQPLRPSQKVHLR